MSARISPIDQLRIAVDFLPVHTRAAMLKGIRSNEIIVGAYSDREGGVCPMLAAHRCGGRTDFISFARAWDRFAGSKRARRATRRELRVLESHLEASLNVELGTEQVGHLDLGTAINDHQASARARREREAAETGGWGFLRARRDRKDAERALEFVEEAADEHALV